MAIFADEFPTDFVPGCDFVQIEDEEFALASEPQGLIAIEIDNDQGYLTVAAAKRLALALSAAIANSEAPRPDVAVGPHAFDDGRADEEIAF